MFVRCHRNKSGTTSVSVVYKPSRNRGKNGYITIKSFGTSKDEAEVSRLKEEAEEYIRSSQGPSLFEIEQADLKRQLLSLQDKYEELERKYNELKVHTDSLRVQACASMMDSVNPQDIQVIGPELIYGTLYDRIGYNEIDRLPNGAIFRHLTITRLFHPGSKLKTLDYLWRYQGIRYTPSKIYRFLDELCFRPKRRLSLESSSLEGSDAIEDIKTKVDRITYEYTKRSCGGSIYAAYYDMTTLYYEAAEEDELRKCGFSKDGKHSCPQIFLGLLVSAEGYPIGYEIYEGNISETNTLIPMLKKMSARYGIGKPVVVADAGLLSLKNMACLIEEGYEFILGARIGSLSDKTREDIQSFHLQDGMVGEIDLGPLDLARIRRLQKGDGKSRYIESELKDLDDEKLKVKNARRLIISMSENRRKKDAVNREKGLLRLEKKVRGNKLNKDHVNNRGYNKYLKMEGEVTISIDYAKFHEDSKWDGLKGWITNTGLPCNKVIEEYKNLAFIELAFRMNKGDLMMRPIYHRLRNRIEGHICICFTAYTILLELKRLLSQAKSDITIYRAEELTKNLYRISYTIPDGSRKSRVVMDDEQKELHRIVNEAETEKWEV